MKLKGPKGELITVPDGMEAAAFEAQANGKLAEFAESLQERSINKKGGMLKRKDGSYSRRGLWDNIRANRGSGRKPTKEMLRQEKKIRAKQGDGGETDGEYPVRSTMTQMSSQQNGNFNNFAENYTATPDMMSYQRQSGPAFTGFYGTPERSEIQSSGPAGESVRVLNLSKPEDYLMNQALANRVNVRAGKKHGGYTMGNMNFDGTINTPFKRRGMYYAGGWTSDQNDGTFTQDDLNYMNKYGTAYEADTPIYNWAGPSKPRNKTNFWRGLGSTLYGILEGAVDTFTFGATDPITDLGYKALTDIADNKTSAEQQRKLDAVRGVGTATGAVGASIINPTAIPAGIASASKGTGQAIQNFAAPDNKTAQIIGTALPIAGSVVGTAYGAGAFNAAAPSTIPTQGTAEVTGLTAASPAASNTWMQSAANIPTAPSTTVPTYTMSAPSAPAVTPTFGAGMGNIPIYTPSPVDTPRQPSKEVQQFTTNLNKYTKYSPYLSQGIRLTQDISEGDFNPAQIAGTAANIGLGLYNQGSNVRENTFQASSRYGPRTSSLKRNTMPNVNIYANPGSGLQSQLNRMGGYVKMADGGQAGLVPINVEGANFSEGSGPNAKKGELLVINGKIIKNYVGRPPHPSEGQNPLGNDDAPEGLIVIPKNRTKEYLEAGLIKRKQIERSLVSQQQDREMKKSRKMGDGGYYSFGMGDQGMAYGGMTGNQVGGVYASGGMPMGNQDRINLESLDSMMTYKKGGWIQKATKSIKRRGTEGVCTGSKFGSSSCPPGSRRYNLAKTFKAMAKNGMITSMSGRKRYDVNSVVNYTPLTPEEEAIQSSITYDRYGKEQEMPFFVNSMLERSFGLGAGPRAEVYLPGKYYPSGYDLNSEITPGYLEPSYYANTTNPKLRGDYFDYSGDQKLSDLNLVGKLDKQNFSINPNSPGNIYNAWMSRITSPNLMQEPRREDESLADFSARTRPSDPKVASILSRMPTPTLPKFEKYTPPTARRYFGLQGSSADDFLASYAPGYSPEYRITENTSSGYPTISQSGTYNAATREPSSPDERYDARGDYYDQSTGTVLPSSVNTDIPTIELDLSEKSGTPSSKSNLNLMQRVKKGMSRIINGVEHDCSSGICRPIRTARNLGMGLGAIEALTSAFTPVSELSWDPMTVAAPNLVDYTEAKRAVKDQALARIYAAKQANPTNLRRFLSATDLDESRAISEVSEREKNYRSQQLDQFEANKRAALQYNNQMGVTAQDYKDRGEANKMEGIFKGLYTAAGAQNQYVNNLAMKRYLDNMSNTYTGKSSLPGTIITDKTQQKTAPTFMTEEQLNRPLFDPTEGGIAAWRKSRYRR